MVRRLSYPFFVAAQNGHLEVLRLSIEVGADKDKANKDGATRMSVAAQNRHIEVVRFLVEVGAIEDQVESDD